MSIIQDAGTFDLLVRFQVAPILMLPLFYVEFGKSLMQNYRTPRILCPI